MNNARNDGANCTAWWTDATDVRQLPVVEAPSSSSSWLLPLLLLVGLAGPCAALLHMIKIYLDQIEKNETSGNNKLVQQRVIRGVGEGECSGGSLWFSCVYCGKRRAGNAEAAIDGPLSRVAHTHTHTFKHARTHTHLCHVCVWHLWCMSDCSMPRQVLALSGAAAVQ